MSSSEYVTSTFDTQTIDGFNLTVFMETYADLMISFTIKSEKGTVLLGTTICLDRDNIEDWRQSNEMVFNFLDSTSWLNFSVDEDGCGYYHLEAEGGMNTIHINFSNETYEKISNEIEKKFSHIFEDSQNSSLGTTQVKT